MSDKIITNEMKGIALIAIGIIIRDTGCTVEDAMNSHFDRYKKLIAKKGKNYALDDEDRVDALSSLTFDELVK